MNNKNDNNFEKYLWNKYEPLHERISKKIINLSKVFSSINDIYTIKKEYYKNINPIIRDSMPLPKEEASYQNILDIMKSTSDNYNKFEEEMYTEILSNIKNLVDKMKKEKNIYDNYVKYYGLYKEENKKLEKFKGIYHQSGKVAERATKDWKDFVIKKKINDNNLIKNQIVILENESKNRLQTMAKDCNAYSNQLDHTNEMRKKANEKQSSLLRLYQELEFEDRNLYYKLIQIINKYQNKILEYTKKENDTVQQILKDINIDQDIRSLIESLKSKDKPEDTIIYQQYPTEMNNNLCNNNKDFRVFTEVVKTMRTFSDKVFMDYDENLEENKNKMRELMYKLFDLNRTMDNSDKQELIEYTKDKRIHELFLITLSKLRTNAKFYRQKETIELLSQCIINILDSAQKTKNYDNIKNCIILSQTFYYVTDPEKKNKVYISEYIKNHSILQSCDFWKDFIIYTLIKELQKIENTNYDNLSKDVSIAKNINVPTNFRAKIGEIIFSQLLPYINHMMEFHVDRKVIVKLIMDISNRYNYLPKSTLDSIYGLVSKEKEEIEKMQKEIMDDKNYEKSFVDEYFIIHKDDFSDDF